MMPLTWGRTSAMREASTRPGSLAVRVTSLASSVTTVTVGGGALPCWALAVAPKSMPQTAEAARARRAKFAVVRI